MFSTKLRLLYFHVLSFALAFFVLKNFIQGNIWLAVIELVFLVGLTGFTIPRTEKRCDKEERELAGIMDNGTGDFQL